MVHDGRRLFYSLGSAGVATVDQWLKVKEVAGDLPLRFGLDGASCVATGAAAWAAGKRLLEPVEAPMEGWKDVEVSVQTPVKIVLFA